MSDRQYAPIVAPFTTAVVPDDTPVGWHRQLPDPTRQLATIALCMAATVAPLHVPDVTQPVVAHSWRSNTAYPDRIPRTVLPRAAHLVFAQNIDPIPNIFSEPGGSVIPTGSTRLWQYLGLTGPLDVPSTVPLILNWQPRYPDRVPGLVTLQASAQRSWQADQFDAPPPPADATANSWTPIYPARPSAAIAQTYRAQAFAIDTQWTTPPITVSLIAWRTRFPDQHRPKPSPAPYVWAQPHFVVEVDVPVMSWTGVYLDPPAKAKGRRSALETKTTAPLYLADITTTAPESSWDGSYPDQTFAVRRSVAAANARGVIPPFVADVTETAPTLSARAIYPDRIASKTSVSTSAQRAWTMDATFTAPAPVVVPALSAPVYPSQVPGRPQPTIHPDTGMPAYVLDVTVPAPTLSWSPQYPDRQRWALTVPQQPAFTTDVTILPTAFKAAWVRFNFYINPAGDDVE